MNLSRRIPLALWLAIAVAFIAIVSHALGQPHDLTFVATVVGCCLCAVDWLITPRERE